MNDNTTWSELARLPISNLEDVIMARFVGREVVAQMGFPPAFLIRLATAISEITRNVVQHAGCPGEVQICRIAQGERVGLRIIVTDKGKGMERSERFLEERTRGLLDSGLTDTRRLVDHFLIESAPGMGTVVTMDLWKGAPTP